MTFNAATRHGCYSRAIKVERGGAVTHHTNRYFNHHLERVFMLMTKPDILAAAMSRKDIADFNFAVGDKPTALLRNWQSHK
jgi:hypothetical protein